MTIEIKVPDMGESVNEGTIARWFKAVGEAVAADEPLVEIETDKVTVEVPSPSTGVLTAIGADEGADVEVGAVIGAIDENATAAPTAAPAQEKPAEEKPAEAATAATPAPTAGAAAAASGETLDVTVPELGESVSEGTVGRWLKQVGESFAADEPLVEIETDKVTAELPAPAAGTLIEIIADEGIDVEVGAIVGRITTGDAAASTADAAPAAAPAPAPAATPAPEPDAARANLDYPLAPAVHKLVDENGLDPTAIPATGRDGRITKGDVMRYLDSRGPGGKTAPAPAAAPAPEGFTKAGDLPERAIDPRGEERVRMSKLRQTVATRLKQAQNSAAMLTTFNEVDMQGVMDLRARYRDDFEKKHGVKLGLDRKSVV